MKKISAIVIMLLLASSAVKTRFRCHVRVKTCRMCRKVSPVVYNNSVSC